ncbi:DUF817 domain-containing protein [Brevibacillus daliensis]|uniref:DUF817 domain-containing protein n=1 Tax=Brevibacillus daliensis TaxID=2892995 RepID=UPI001E55844C|nr:DUF817 domain-containing protein [Brevibacillus daliensis]
MSPSISQYIRLFVSFTYHQAMSCLFPVGIFILLALSQIISIPGLPRYDFLLIGCLIIQGLMIYFRLESRQEILVICVFHLIGLALEIFKVHMGSWSYPEEAYTMIAGVPLYSGFMYASVASYICQAWRRLHLSLTNWPLSFLTITLGASIYFNFFWHHFWIDVRWFLMAILFIIFWKTKVYFTLLDKRFYMPLTLSYFLIGFFIWIAENIATLLGAWQYPNQSNGWELVHISKISSWFLLIIVSFIIVAQLKHVKGHLSSSAEKHPTFVQD